MVGLPKNSVMLYTYSEEWSMLFEKEKINIYNCIKEYVIDIQHVGSTSIKGMYAKPIIDIVVAIKNLEDGFKLIEAIGYHFKGSLGKSNRFFFWKGNEKNNTHNLHIVQHGDKNFDNLILFRNFMNNHCDYREEYCRLKLDLANKYKDDRDTYTKARLNLLLM